MRDYRKLKAFEFADELALMVYRETSNFPKEELFGLTRQLRRAAVSIPSNIVEGSGRDSEADYLRFLNIAYGSASETCYQLSLAYRLEYMSDNSYRKIEQKSDKTARVLNGLINALRRNKNKISSHRPQDSGLKK
ncbi:MAG: four helix bundle protein [Planctomycetes bacterium]|nr:four helix bundle protein [Planctomycetota bacterium]